MIDGEVLHVLDAHAVIELKIVADVSDRVVTNAPVFENLPIDFGGERLWCVSRHDAVPICS